MSILRAYYTTLEIAQALQDDLGAYISADPEFWVSTYRSDTHILLLLNGDTTDQAVMAGTSGIIDSGVGNIRTDTQLPLSDFSISTALSAYPGLTSAAFVPAQDVGDAITVIMRHLESDAPALSYDNTPMPSGTFTDDFTGADGQKLEVRAGWAELAAGSFQAEIKDNALCASSPGGTNRSAYICTDQESANQYIQITDRVFTAVSYIYAAIRLQDENNYIGYHLAGTGSAGARLCKRVSGSLTDSIVTTQGGVGYKFKIECDGTTVRFFKDTGGGFGQVGTDQTISDFQTVTRAGFVLGDDCSFGKFDDWENGTVGSTILPINLSADDITTGTPAVGSPTLGQTHQLDAADVTTDSPAVSAPALAEAVDSLAATDITAGIPAVDVPALGQVHALAGQDLTTQTPTLTAPSMSESTDNLTASDIITGAPVIDQPGLAQTHGLTATGITLGQPTVTAPDLTAVEGVDSLTAPDVVTQAPAVGAPGLGQVHALNGANIDAGVPAADVPAVGQVQGLIGADITTGQPVVSSPTVAQGAHSLAALDITTGIPVVEAPGLGQVHALISSDVVTGPLFISAPALDWDAPITPAIRTYSVDADAENRTFKIEYENRTFKI